jgi:hypothetical protein
MPAKGRTTITMTPHPSSNLDGERVDRRKQGQMSPHHRDVIDCSDCVGDGVLDRRSWGLGPDIGRTGSPRRTASRRSDP